MHVLLNKITAMNICIFLINKELNKEQMFHVLVSLQGVHWQVAGCFVQSEVNEGMPWRLQVGDRAGRRPEPWIPGTYWSDAWSDWWVLHTLYTLSCKGHIRVNSQTDSLVICRVLYFRTTSYENVPFFSIHPTSHFNNFLQELTIGLQPSQYFMGRKKRSSLFDALIFCKLGLLLQTANIPQMNKTRPSGKRKGEVAGFFTMDHKGIQLPEFIFVFLSLPPCPCPSPPKKRRNPTKFCFTMMCNILNSLLFIYRDV